MEQMTKKGVLAKEHVVKKNVVYATHAVKGFDSHGHQMNNPLPRTKTINGGAGMGRSTKRSTEHTVKDPHTRAEERAAKAPDHHKDKSSCLSPMARAALGATRLLSATKASGSPNLGATSPLSPVTGTKSKPAMA